MEFHCDLFILKGPKSKAGIVLDKPFVQIDPTRRVLPVKIRVALLATLCLALAAIPAFAGTLYNNGPLNGTGKPPYISKTSSGNNEVSDSFYLSSFLGATVYGFELYIWEGVNYQLSSIQWSISSKDLGGGTVYGSGTASGSNLSDKYITTNKSGYDIDLITVTGLHVNFNGVGTYWLNLQQAVSKCPTGQHCSITNPGVFWDENSGVGCQSPGCPSQAYDSGVMGTIPSESFTVSGQYNPEPSSIVLFGTGIVALAGLLRRKL